MLCCLRQARSSMNKSSEETKSMHGQHNHCSQALACLKGTPASPLSFSFLFFFLSFFDSPPLSLSLPPSLSPSLPLSLSWDQLGFYFSKRDKLAWLMCSVLSWRHSTIKLLPVPNPHVVWSYCYSLFGKRRFQNEHLIFFMLGKQSMILTRCFFLLVHV